MWIYTAVNRKFILALFVLWFRFQPSVSVVSFLRVFLLSRFHPTAFRTITSWNCWKSSVFRLDHLSIVDCLCKIRLFFLILHSIDRIFTLVFFSTYLKTRGSTIFTLNIDFSKSIAYIVQFLCIWSVRYLGCWLVVALNVIFSSF